MTHRIQAERNVVPFDPASSQSRTIRVSALRHGRPKTLPKQPVTEPTRHDEFVSLKAGGLDLIFPATAHLRLPFTFPTSVQTAHAVLQSFHLEVDHSDSHVKDVQVSLTTFFDPVQSTTSGEVEVAFERTGSDGNSAPFAFPEPEAISAEVRILVIG